MDQESEINSGTLMTWCTKADLFHWSWSRLYI